MSLRESYRYSPGASGLRGGLGARRPAAGRWFGRESVLRHLDWLLILAVLALCVLGVLLVWSATEPAQRQLGADPHAYLFKDALWLGIGLVLIDRKSVV